MAKLNLFYAKIDSHSCAQSPGPHFHTSLPRYHSSTPFGGPRKIDSVTTNFLFFFQLVFRSTQIKHLLEMLPKRLLLLLLFFCNLVLTIMFVFTDWVRRLKSRVLYICTKLRNCGPRTTIHELKALFCRVNQHMGQKCTFPTRTARLGRAFFNMLISASAIG